jgi:hypothetical protein
MGSLTAQFFLADQIEINAAELANFQTSHVGSDQRYHLLVNRAVISSKVQMHNCLNSISS